MGHLPGAARPLGLALAFTLVAAAPAGAKSKWKSKGSLAVEGRLFSNDGLPTTEDRGLGLFGRLEVEHRNRPFRERLRIFGRLDAFDDQRTILAVEEAWAEWRKKKLRFRIGFDILNWTATEAFHPADILNSRNLDSDLENFEKLGEPMVAMQYRIGSGSINAYFMPAYISPIFPSPASRLGFGALGDAVRLDRNGEEVDGDPALQGALRIKQTLGDADIGVHAIHHVDRSQPLIGFDIANAQFVPVFRTVTQFGGTYQHVFDALIFKVEAGYRLFSANGATTRFGALEDIDHLQAAAGFEYGMVHASGTESTLIVEGQSLFGVTKAQRARLSIFQRDVLFGYRLSMNDVAGTTLLISAIFDVERSSEVLFNFTFDRRLSDTWTVSVSGRIYEAKRPPLGTIPSGIQLLRKSDHARIALTRHF